jgi:hypothetical protein
MAPLGGHDHQVIKHTKNLRHPIHAELAGELCDLMTVGHVAAAPGRSSWTVRHWQRLGLLPPTPFFIHAEIPNLRRLLFPREFVEVLSTIADEGLLGRRLNRDDWTRFHRDVLVAYEATVLPLS